MDELTIHGFAVSEPMSISMMIEFFFTGYQILGLDPINSLFSTNHTDCHPCVDSRYEAVWLFRESLLALQLAFISAHSIFRRMIAIYFYFVFSKAA